MSPSLVAEHEGARQPCFTKSAEEPACFTNEQELCEEATLLLEHDMSLRSAALAVIGQEEFAKAVAYTIAALLPEQRHYLPSTIDGHALKHRVCRIANGVEMMYDEMCNALWDTGYAFGGSTPLDRLVELFFCLAEGGLNNLLDKKEAPQYYKELRVEHEEERQRCSHLQVDR